MTGMIPPPVVERDYCGVLAVPATFLHQGFTYKIISGGLVSPSKVRAKFRRIDSYA